MNVNRIIRTLKDASDDNARIAALFAAGKLVDISNLPNERKIALLDAIGFTFLNRLMGDEPQEHVALSIFCAFLDLDEFVHHPSFLGHTPSFNRIIETCAKGSVANDTADCLYCIALKSPQTLLAHGTVKSLLKAFSVCTGKNLLDKYLQIYGVLVSHITNSDADLTSDIEHLIETCRDKLVDPKDMNEVHHVLNFTQQIVNSTPNHLMNENIPKHLVNYLFKALSSRLDTKTLNLCALLYMSASRKFGLEALHSVDHKCVVLVVNRILIELAFMMANLDKLSETERNKSENQICEYFSFIEEFIIAVSSGRLTLKNADLLAVIDMIVGLLRSVCDLLQAAMRQSMNPLFMTACIRLVCSFLVEETMLLSDTIPYLLPALLDHCCEHLPDAMRFILPALRACLPEIESVNRNFHAALIKLLSTPYCGDAMQLLSMLNKDLSPEHIDTLCQYLVSTMKEDKENLNAINLTLSLMMKTGFQKLNNLLNCANRDPPIMDIPSFLGQLSTMQLPEESRSLINRLRDMQYVFNPAIYSLIEKL